MCVCVWLESLILVFAKPGAHMRLTYLLVLQGRTASSVNGVSCG